MRQHDGFLFRTGASALRLPFASSGRLRPDLSRVEFRLPMGKPHDDFCGLLPIGVGPQIERSNDLVERLEKKCDRPRIEGSVVSACASMARLEPPGCGGTCSVAITTRPGLVARGRGAFTSNKKAQTCLPQVWVSGRLCDGPGGVRHGPLFTDHELQKRSIYDVVSACLLELARAQEGM